MNKYDIFDITDKQILMMESLILSNPQFLTSISQFLSLPQQLRLAQLSKTMLYTVEQLCQRTIQSLNLPLIKTKTCIHQMRFFFDRCLRVFKQQRICENESKDKGSEQKQKFTQQLYFSIKYPFKFHVITYFEIGPVFSCCLTIEKKAFIYRSSDILEGVSEKALRYEVREDVRDIKCKGEQLLYLRSNGTLSICEGVKHDEAIVSKEHVEEWSKVLPAVKIEASYTYAVIVLETCKLGSINEYVLHKESEAECEDTLYHLCYNQSTHTWSPLSIRCKQIHSVAVGKYECYILAEQCFVVEFVDKEYKAKVYHPFSGKDIVKISTGYNYFVALERCSAIIEEYSVAEVMVWLEEKGFGDYVKIAEALRIDGKMLIKLDKKFMERSMAMTKNNVQQKLIMCIQDGVDGNDCLEQLYVWGKNQYGQLGVSNSNYIAQPIKIRMGWLGDADKIDRVFCGWTQTFVRTKKGKIYRTVTTVEKRKKKYSYQKQQEEIQQDIKTKKNKKKYHFEKQQEQTEQDNKIKRNKKRNHHHGAEIKGNRKFQEEVRWVESINGKAFLVDGYKDYIFYIQCPSQTQFEPKKQKKLRTAKNVLDRIMWNQRYDLTQFKVGYMDKQMGVIQAQIPQIYSYDFKQARVKYIKQKNVVVWSRDNKTDYLQ